MRIYTQGEGDNSVLYIHGFLENRSMWDFVPANSGKKVCIEIPGHGDEPLFVYKDMEELAREIHSDLKKNGIQPSRIVGHSMGGYIAIELFKLDQSIEELVLLNSNFWCDSDLKKQDRKRVAEIVYQQKRLFLETAIPNLFGHREPFKTEITELIEAADQMSPDAIAIASIAMANRNDNTAYLKKESRKILIIQGEIDNIVPADQMLSATEGWNTPVLVQSGHMSHIEVEDKVREYLN